jgi:hypothetical protein
MFIYEIGIIFLTFGPTTARILRRNYDKFNVKNWLVILYRHSHPYTKYYEHIKLREITEISVLTLFFKSAVKIRVQCKLTCPY